MMQVKRRILWFFLFLLFVGISGLLLLYWRTQLSPVFYDEALRASPPSPRRQEVAERVAGRTRAITRDFQERKKWTIEYTESELNSWLAEKVGETVPEWWPPEIRAPRMKLEPELVRLAFRLNSSEFKGIVAVTLRPRLVSPREIRMSIESVQWGRLFVSEEYVVDGLNPDNIPLDEGWSMGWLETESGWVLSIQIDPSQLGNRRIEELQVEEGRIRIRGN